MATSVGYPLRVEGHLDPGLSRWLWLVKWVLAIPHYIVLAFLWIGFLVTSVVAFFAILFTGRYPRVLFDFNVGVLRWTWRVGYYAYGALGTDRYPPFTLDDVPDYPARLEATYPQHLSRGLVLVKWWLLALPHYIIAGLFVGGGTWFAWQSDNETFAWAPGGLIGVLVLIAAIVLLVTGSYPRPIFDFVLGLNRWVLRVAAYAGLLTDTYPPFRLDMGDNEPGTLAFVGPALPPPPSAPTAGTRDLAGGYGSPPNAGGPSPTSPTRFSAGRIVAIVVGAILALVSFGLLVGGASALALDRTERDDAGFLRTPTEQLVTDASAISSQRTEFQVGSLGDPVARQLLGDVEVRVSSTEKLVFIGVAKRTDALAYLANFRSADISYLGGANPRYTTHGEGVPATEPAAIDIWADYASGSGQQTLQWQPTTGDWVLVVMNADGSPGVNVTADVGAELPILTGVAVGMLVGGFLLLGAATVTITLAARRAERPPE